MQSRAATQRGGKHGRIKTMGNKWVSSNDAAQAVDVAQAWVQHNTGAAYAVAVVGLMFVVTVYTKLKG
jgi:hypothetical protein